LTFYLVVRAKRNGRILDETILEFKNQPSPKKLEEEIHMAQRDLQKYWNLKDIEFSTVYAKTEQEAKRSQLWSVYGKGHYIVRK
jgi:CRP-like cAMP-binding protein